MHLHKNVVITVAVAVIAFFAGWLLSPSKEIAVRTAEAAKPELRSIDCSKMVIVQKGRGETLTVTQPNWAFLKIPDPLGGQSVNEKHVREYVQEHLNKNRGEFFAEDGQSIYVTEVEVVEQGNVRYPDPNYAFINVRFVVDKSQ